MVEMEKNNCARCGLDIESGMDGYFCRYCFAKIGHNEEKMRKYIKEE